MSQPVILQVIPALGTGGAEQTTVDVGRAISQAGWTSVVASGGGRLVSKLCDGGSEHVRLPLDTKNPIAIWNNAGRLERLIKDRGVNIIHARSRAPAWSCLIAARRTGIPFVTTYHGAYSEQNRLKALYNSVMARADIVIANSQWTADLIVARYPFAAGNITSIPRGTDMRAFERGAISTSRREALHSSWGTLETDTIVLHLARLTGWKGQNVVIDAATRLKKSFPNVRYILAGDSQGRSEYARNLRSKITDRELEENVLLPGHCDDPAAAMAIADFVVVASTEPEAFGRAAVEAGALCKPVIVTQLGAVGETVLADSDAERTGWKVPPGDANAMADALEQLLRLDNNTRNEIGQRARKHVSEQFSMELMCSRTLETYEALLAR